MDLVLTIPFCIGVALMGIATFFEFINGTHDAGHAITTVVKSGAMKKEYAMWMAAFFNFAGALTVGTGVAVVITKIVPANAVSAELLAAVLLGGLVWNVGTWYKGIPASSSHCLIGSLIGAALAAHGFDTIAHTPSVMQAWNGSSSIFDGVVNTTVAVFNSEPVFQSAEVVKAFKGLLYSPLIGAGMALAAILLIRLVAFGISPLARHLPQGLVHAFAPPADSGKVSVPARGTMIAASCSLAFSHGSNDGQKMMGVMSLILATQFPQFGFTSGHVVLWVMILCATAISLGTRIGGGRIIEAQGKMSNKPIGLAIGNAAQISTALIVFGASWLGTPVSTTHVLTSAIVGAQLGQNGPRHMNGKLLGKIAFAWVVTLPFCMIVAAALFVGIKALGL